MEEEAFGRKENGFAGGGAEEMKKVTSGYLEALGRRTAHGNWAEESRDSHT